MTEKILVFDMDGTLANFYGVDGWLNDLMNENTRPYEIANPLYDMQVLNSVLAQLKMNGYKIIITTWLSKGATKDFENRTRKAKIEWLAKFGFEYDEIHLVKYGTTKANCTRKYGYGQTLFDDNEQIRNGWHLGTSVNANENILEYLVNLL